jgi:hypothetical protein
LSGEQPSFNAGANESLTFAVVQKHNEFHSVNARRVSEYEAEYADIKDRRLMRRRRDALDAKIEKSEVSWEPVSKNETLIDVADNDLLIRFSCVSRRRNFYLKQDWCPKASKTSCIWPLTRSVAVPVTSLCILFDNYERQGTTAPLDVSTKDLEQDIDFTEPDDYWVPSNDTLGLADTRGTAPGEARPQRVLGDENLATLNAKVHDPNSVYELQDMRLLDELGRASDLSGAEILEVLSRRLGLGHEKEEAGAIVLRRVDQSLPRMRGAAEEDEAEFDSDDDMFTLEDDGLHVISSSQVFVNRNVGRTPQTAEEHVRALKEERSATRDGGLVKQLQVPSLSLGRTGGELVEVTGAVEDLTVWRRMPKAEIVPSQFFGQFKKKHTLGGDVSSTNKSVYLLPVVSREYMPENFEVPYAAMFVGDARRDMERAAATLDANLRREDELALRVAPADESLGAQEMTSVELYLVRQQADAKAAYNADQAEMLLLSAADLRARVVEKAIMAAKTSNVALMEEALDTDLEGGGISPDTTRDELGNTLLILASQQGSKRMCKLLLRRGANINRQNSTTGSTCLHFCHVFSHLELAKYLISKGADDALLNSDGYTCYEANIITSLE